MAKKYIKNARGQYVYPAYLQVWPWTLIAVLIAGLLSYLDHNLNFNLFKAVLLCWTLVALMILGQLTLLILKIHKAKTIKRYLTQKSLEKNVTKSLLATMTVNLSKDSPFIEVPDVKVFQDEELFNLEIEKLAGMYEFDKLKQDINTSFRGRYNGYAVTVSEANPEGTAFHFKLEDVAVDKTLRPKSIKDFKIKKYKIKLQKGLTINLVDLPHIAVWGQTGSRKSTVLFGIIHQLFGMGADVYFLDGKNEFSPFRVFYPKSKIVSKSDQALNLMDQIVATIDARQELLEEEVVKRYKKGLLSKKKDSKMGLKASDLNLRPVALVADEIASVMASMDSKQSKAFTASLMSAIQRARSAGVSIIISTQDPSVETLPQKIRGQFTTKILLGSANAEIQKMAFGQVATDGDVKVGRGYYVSHGLTVQPMLFYVNDLYTHNMMGLETFEQAYSMGLEVKYALEGGDKNERTENLFYGLE